MTQNASAYQLKLDGYRATAFKTGGKVHLAELPIGASLGHLLLFDLMMLAGRNVTDHKMWRSRANAHQLYTPS